MYLHVYCHFRLAVMEMVEASMSQENMLHAVTFINSAELVLRLIRLPTALTKTEEHGRTGRLVPLPSIKKWSTRVVM